MLGILFLLLIISLLLSLAFYSCDRDVAGNVFAFLVGVFLVALVSTSLVGSFII